MPYMDQVPVFDADSTDRRLRCRPNLVGRRAAEDVVLHSGRAAVDRSSGLHTLTNPGLRNLRPFYLTALFLGIEPSIPMVNWINTFEHGLIALAAAFIAFSIALLNRLGKSASGLIAVGVSFPILLSRGPLYVFSQIYDVTNAV